MYHIFISSPNFIFLLCRHCVSVWEKKQAKETMKLERLLASRLEFYQGFREPTRAIQLVALSKLQGLNYRLKGRQKSLVILHHIFDSGVNMSTANRYVIIIIGTDKSCCGALNANLFASSRELINRLEDAAKDIELIPFGDKAKHFVKKEYRRYHKLSFMNVDKEYPSFSLAAIILERIMKRQIRPVYRRKRRLIVSKYVIVFSRYISISHQRISAYISFSPEVLKRYFLWSQARLQKKNKMLYAFMRKKSNPERWIGLSYLYNLFYFTGSLALLDATEEHEYSELGARATTMENAYNNIKDIIDRVRLAYNRVRQDTITTDLVEIVSGQLFARND